MAEWDQEVNGVDRNRDIVSALESENKIYDSTVPWPVLLEWLERFCVHQNWDIEYDSVEDESCAIFYQPG